MTVHTGAQVPGGLCRRGWRRWGRQWSRCRTRCTSRHLWRPNHRSLTSSISRPSGNCDSYYNLAWVWGQRRRGRVAGKVMATCTRRFPWPWTLDTCQAGSRARRRIGPSPYRTVGVADWRDTHSEPRALGPCSGQAWGSSARRSGCLSWAWDSPQDSGLVVSPVAGTVERSLATRVGEDRQVVLHARTAVLLRVSSH
jgi:hypothetical protein